MQKIGQLGTPTEPGIMFLTLNDLFQEIDEQEDFTYQLTLSYLEVYNETIRDLLNPSTELLDLREDPIKGMKVVGITEIAANNVMEVMELLRTGNRNRTQEATHANEESSRSHAVLQVVVEQKDKTADTKTLLKIGKLSMIDLAGSERASRTKVWPFFSKKKISLGSYNLF